MGYNFSPIKIATSSKRACFKCPSQVMVSDSSILVSGGSSNSKSIFASQTSQTSSLNTPHANIQKISGKSASLSTMNSGLVDTDVLSTSEIDGFKLLSDSNFNGVEVSNVNIISGTINGTSIGSIEPDVGYFTNLYGEDTHILGDLFVNNKIIFQNNPNIFMQNLGDTLQISTTGILSLSASAISNLNTSGPLTLYDKLYFKNQSVFFDQSNSGTLTLSTTGAINISCDDITTNEFLEQQWLSYKDFNFLCYSGLVSVKNNFTTDINNINNFYLHTNNLNSGQFYLTSDVSQIIRNQNGRGMKLTGIYVNYEILTDTLNNFTGKINKFTLSGLGLRDSITETSFSLSTSINVHYNYIPITSEYLDIHNYLNIELNIDKKILSDFKFYGIMLEFNKRFF